MRAGAIVGKTPETESDVLHDLVNQAQQGSRNAQQALLERFWPVIRQAVRARKNRVGRALAGREETQDIEQAAAMKILRELGKHEWRGKSALSAWIGKLAALEVVDLYRYHRAEKRDAGAETGEAKVDLGFAGPSMESVYETKQRMDDLLHKVSKLKADYGAALLMHHMGFAHEEIGNALDCTAEAARKLVSRARKKLVDMDD